MTTTTPATPTKHYRTLNPATGELVREFDSLTDEQAQDLLARAHTAFLDWRHTPVERKVELFRTFADLVEANADELARLTTEEMGKPLAQSVGETGQVADIFRWFADHGPALLEETVTDTPGVSRTITRREPIGVVLGVEPWNGPMYQAMRATAPNLFLGNTVLVKPAAICPGTTLFFDDLVTQAGFPPDVYHTALVSSSQVSDYIRDDRIRAVTLTGSDTAGSIVGEQAGREIKPVVLELGGSDAFIVLDSADATRAAANAAACRLVIGGQVCASPKRMIVTEGAADEFISAFTESFADQVVGDPFDPATTVGPLSTQDAVDTLQAQYQDALDKGATELIAGGAVEGPGAFFRPAALTGITPEMRLYTEEAFGPLAMIYRVPDADAAVELANSSVYGLGGTVFGEQEEAFAVAERLDTGAVGVNGWFGAPIEVPFGGVKRSGVGRELGTVGLDAFSNLKTYGIN